MPVVVVCTNVDATLYSFRCEKNIDLVVDLSAEENNDIEASIKTDKGPTDTEEFEHTERSKAMSASAPLCYKKEPEEDAPPTDSHSDLNNSDVCCIDENIISPDA